MKFTVSLIAPATDNNIQNFTAFDATLRSPKLEQESKGLMRDSDIGYAPGLQVGILQELNRNTSIEAGYRYLRSNASTEMAPDGAAKAGSLDLRSSSQVYLGANYAF